MPGRGSRRLSPNARATVNRATDDGRAGETMHADDERDPLDRWLSQQVQPLPPPPGTFELITRRARRRKLRKLAVTMVSAAAVAAAVAVAVPVGLNLHLSPPSAKASNVADSASPTHLTESPDGSASPIKTASPSPSSTHPAIAPVEPAHPVPANFQPVVGHVRERAGRLGDRPGRHPRAVRQQGPVHLHVDRADRRRRAELAGRPGPGHQRPERRDRGQRHQVPQRHATAGPSAPSCGRPTTAGTTWSKVDTSGARVTDLETSSGRAYALWATGCPTASGGSSSGFAAGCTSYTLMTATAGSGDWTPVGPATSGLGDGGAATSAVLELTGSNGYLLAPDGALYSGAIGGTWSQVGTSACKPGPAQADGLPSAAQLALVDSSRALDRLQRDVGGLAARAVHVRQTAARRGPSRPPPRGRTSPTSATSASPRRWRRRRTARSRWPPPPGSTACRPAASAGSRATPPAAAPRRAGSATSA